MDTKPSSPVVLKKLLHLPAFADFILQHKLEEFTRQQMVYAREHQLPLLDALSALEPTEVFRISKEGNERMLRHLADDQMEMLIESSMQRWTGNALPFLDKLQISLIDINILSFVRKKSLTDLIVGYTKDAGEVIALVEEIDYFLFQQELAGTRTCSGLMLEQSDQANRFIQKVNETIPGAVYVFDMLQQKGIFSNPQLAEVFGHTQAELNEHGNVLASIVHPADAPALKAAAAQLMRSRDGDVISTQYRVRTREGIYKWVKSFESVFRRNENGDVVEIIGIALDTDEEHRITKALQENERRHLRAEALTHIGSYEWNLETNALIWSEELYHIYGLDPAVPVSFEVAGSLNHPSDIAAIREAYQSAIEKEKGFDFHYRILSKRDAGFRTLHAIGEFVKGTDGNAASVIGTVQDVTERSALLKQLEHNEALHKQGEALTHTGSWTWDLRSGKIDWSDQMYAIYEIDKPVGSDVFHAFVHPDDRAKTAAVLEDLKKNGTADHTFRIVCNNGKVKKLHTVARMHYDENGEPAYVAGAEQDITEKEDLLDKLSQRDRIYKQAEELANMGNWNWDLSRDSIEWTDQLYTIYGLKPQSESITLDRFLSFVHPDDRATVDVDLATYKEDVLDYTFRINTADGKPKVLRSVAQIHRDATGKPLMLVGVERDITEKQNLINRLRESEQNYKQAQSLAHLGSWTFDPARGEFSWSDEMYTIYGIHAGEDVSLESWLQKTEPGEIETVRSAFGKSLKDGSLLDIVHRLRVGDQEWKTVHTIGEVIANRQGSIVKMIGTTQDITEEFRTQQELLDNQVFIRKITDATPSIIASYNTLTGNFAFVSAGIFKLLGYTVEETMAGGVSFIGSKIHPDDLPSVREKHYAILQRANEKAGGGTVLEFTCRLQRKDGAYGWFHTYSTIFDRDVNGKVAHVLTITLDISQQVQATETIKAQEHFIQQIADASPTILYLYNVNKQRVEYINREIFFILGYTPEEILDMDGSVVRELYHPDDYHLLPARKESGKNFQQLDSMLQYECRMKTRQGDWQWLLVREIVFKSDEQGAVTQILGAALDINKRKEMEKTILQNTLLLEQSNASLEEFAYVASHDLKEPLRKISTFGDRLAASQKESLSPEGRLYLHKIVDASQRMQTMISDLLAISMIRGNTQFELFSLQTILDETIQTLEFKIEQQNALIQSDPLPVAQIIPFQFRQLFLNLLSNSLKFTRPGVDPVIRIEYKLLQPGDGQSVQTDLTKPWHQLIFSDNGIGFDNEYAGKIFAIFQRLHGRSEYEGSGIGLAICKKIVEHHGGSIQAAGVEGIGSTFTLILPA